MLSKKRGKQNFGESLARSSKGLAMGIFEGVTGVAMKPIGNNFLLKIRKKTNFLTVFSPIFLTEGAKQEGVGGFFKGMGKGVVGLVARPTGKVLIFSQKKFWLNEM